MVTLDQAGWNRPAVDLVPAPPAIREFVDFLWIDERPRLSPRSHQWRVVADDAAHIIYCRATDRVAHTDRSRLHVVGARQRYVDVDCSHRLVTVGARLKAGAVPALFRVSARELTDRSVAVDSVVRPRLVRSLARFDDGSPRDAAHCLATFVGELAARGHAIDARARQLAVSSESGRSIRDVASEMGVGDRALRAWCSAHLGLGLRRFLSIRRLHHALETRLQHPATTWSRVAAATGFADQSHLVRDCHSLLGESPGDFLARAG